MKKLQKFFEAVKAISSKPYLLNLVLNEQGVQQNKFKEKYPDISALPQIKLQDLDDNFESSVESFLLDGSSLPTDLALLKTLAKGKKSYFEIGTWRGESIWNVAKNIEDCTTLNLGDEEMKAMNLPEKYIELHGFLSKKNPKILHLKGNTLTFDFQNLQKKYDLIFIDGDHSYEMVKHDTQKVFQHLIHENSVVVWHDYAYNPEKIRYEVFRGIMDGTPKEFHHKLHHVANTMCAVMLNGKQQLTQQFESPKTPEVLFKIDLKISNL